MLLKTQTGKSGIFEGGEINFFLAEISPESVKNGKNERIEQNFSKKLENLEKNPCKSHCGVYNCI
jgi:hypothetical protein